MHIVLAWFITFNFINISWVFFRAKDFGDALKVLKGMFFGEFMLPDKYAGKLTFLHEWGVSFGYVFKEIGGKPKTLVYIILAFIIVLAFQNANTMRENFQYNRKNLLITITFLFVAISMMSRVSEFLYFNF
jgi:D-alanyl-lipoteichoic acid acyltransferase DltB (MBOAT superfamily)